MSDTYTPPTSIKDAVSQLKDKSSAKVLISPPGYSVGAEAQKLIDAIEDLSFWGTTEDKEGKKVSLGKGKISNNLPPALMQALQHVWLTNLSYTAAKAKTKDTAATPLQLRFQLQWKDKPWDIIPGMLQIADPSIAFQVEQRTDPGTAKKSYLLRAYLGSTLLVDGLPIELMAEFPGMLFKASLKKPAGEAAAKPSAQQLLQRFQLPKHFTQDKAHQEAFKLTALDFMGDARNKRLLAHLAMGDLPLYGKSVLLKNLELQVEYQGGQNNDLSGLMWGKLEFPKISIEDTTTPLSIDLLAAHPGPEAGWQFAGSLSLRQIPVGRLIKHLAEQLGDASALPNSITQLQLDVESLAVSYDTSSREFQFLCALDFFAGSKEVDFVLKARMKPIMDQDKKITGYEKTFSGQLIVKLADEQLEFDVVFDDNGADTAFVAAYQNLAGKSIDVGKLINALSPDAPAKSLKGFSLDIKDAYFLYKKTAVAAAGAKPAAELFWGADWGLGMQLTDMPLVGKFFSPGSTLSATFQPVFVSKPPEAGKEADFPQRWQPLLSLLPGGSISLPEVTYTNGQKVYLGMKLNMAGAEVPLSLPPAGGGADTPPPIQLGSNDANTAPQIGMTADTGIKWMNIQKSFGPLHFGRVGFKFEKPNVSLYLDGSLSAAGLSIALEGLQFRANINQLKDQPFEPSLSGLGIDYQAGALEIGGTFLHSTTGLAAGVKEEYDGLAVIGYKDLSIDAIGSYAVMTQGEASLFIYALVNYPLGGPSFFFVTGLAAGFGYNRKLLLPPIEQVKQFPLVANAMNANAKPAEGPAEGEKVGQSARLQNEISSLRTYIPPKLGEYFIAAGIKFNSFKLIDSFVILAVNFGKDFEIDILGLSKLVAPQPEKGKSISPIAEIDLALRATFVPAKGFLGVRAQLTSNSYIFSEKCHLTGGFAFYSWFKPSVHAGDFVITIGGYHPSFSVPAHYPRVPRLAFNWPVSDNLHVKGDSYFALTAHALMAGGHLEAVWNSGSLSAWFKIGADFIVSWQPYFYEAHFYVEMGIAVTFNFFGTHHLRISLGADLHVWGPDFSGKARIDYHVGSKEVSFGKASPSPQKLVWPQFKQAFLPDTFLTASLQKGLVRKSDQKAMANQIHLGIVNPKELQIAIETVVPLTASPSHSSLKPAGEAKENIARIGIAPMALQMGSVTSTLKITSFTKDKNEITEVVFQCSPIYKKAPAALWGDEFKPSVNSPSFIEQSLSGITIKALETSLGAGKPLSPIPSQKECTSHPQTYSTASPTFQGGKPDALQALLQDQAVVNKRNGLLASLGFDDAAVQLTPALAGSYTDEPLVGSLTFAKKQ